MSVPSMVHRSGDALVVRSVVSGDALFGTAAPTEDADEELSEIVEDKDLPECKIKRNYSCPNCDYFTQNPRNFLYHLRDVHKEKVKIYECPNCLYASKHYQKLLRHAKMVHGTAEGIELPRGKKRNATEDEEQEMEQDKEDNDQDQAESDAEDEEKHSSFKCSQCSFMAKNQNLVNKHEKEEHVMKIKAKFFKCTKCSYTTPIKARFTKHTKYHSMPMIKCDLCDFKTPYKWNLDRHCKNHNGTGIYRCSACNFTADIKQSLTVHEMNHHVPPVGQAAGIGVGKRRNKVGASDTMANDDGTTQVLTQSELLQSETNSTVDTKKSKIQPPAKKTKSSESRQSNAYGADFINPDDIIHHANGHIYIKNKCKLCNYKSAWDGEMAKHEEKVHNIIRNNNNNISNNFKPEKKKTLKPLPNLIPLNQPSKVPQQFCQPTNMNTSPIPSTEPVYSQKDFNDICAKSINSDLKDFASLIDSDVFKNVEKQPANIPDLIPTSSFSAKKSKGSSFFDKFKTNLTTDNLRCNLCGHESKCLTEFDAHKKICGGKTHYHTPSPIPRHNISSTRCQFCRQRCKSSIDLINHLQTCLEAVKSLKESEQLESKSEEPHPMENRVFVWNNIQVPMDIEITDTNDEVQYEYIEEKQDDNTSLDLSIRTQSPNSENSFISIEPTPTPPTTVTTEKIPTHGNDISIAQHKRVFKCPHCTFWASTASRFHVHIVGHLNKKPFECSLCSYRSNWRWDITKHIKLKSVRDPAHETAKVLMTDETGRRNYTKYNKYLTEINVSGDHNETSGGSGTRPRNHESPSQVLPNKQELPKLNKAPTSSDFSPLLRSPRPVPGLKIAADLSKVASEKKKTGSDSKKTLWQCKKCNFRDPSRDKLLAHVRTHYPPATSNGGDVPPNQEIDEASVGGGYSRGQAPFRCGHCQQVSNWKHVIQRHCRLKHSGDIRVVIGSKNGPDKIEVEEHVDEQDFVDIPQTGLYKCTQCPYSTNDGEDLDRHLEGHFMKENNITRCSLCNYHVSTRGELFDHLRLHGITDPEEYLLKQDAEISKRYQCNICPYDTNSKSQFSYHKQFHKPQGHQYTCQMCGYNVSKRHLLHQHMKVHENLKQNGDVIDLEEVSDEIEEVPQGSGIDLQLFIDIPLVWVSKSGKFTKMYKCRFCPHVNLRKVNIQDHEKMHGVREKNSGNKLNEIEHRCPDCNYVCNNAGVLSSHSKVHQGLYGKIHGLVDLKRSDEEQINEMSGGYHHQAAMESDDDFSELVIDCNEETNSETNTESFLYFCDKCPARFLKEAEFFIHLKFHGARLIYKCEHCSYTARQGPHILAHNNVHSDEYQKRTQIFKGMYCTHPEYQPPKVIRKVSDSNEFANVVNENDHKSLNADMETEPECSIALNKTMKLSLSVPLSGTELFQQKNEAQLKQRINTSIDVIKETTSTRTDPQFGSLMLGNPDFVYPTCVKNGKTKEKRYKCHKCPSAFEKREQYKVHLGLHGAKSKYSCDQCDYSVKYYANYTQHIKKHQMNADAIAKKYPEMEIDDDEIETDKKLFNCTNCPYVNVRRDSVDNHMKKHSSISGLSSTYTCEHCDYSVPQAHVLRDHVKLHFTSQKSSHPEGYMVCDNIKLTSRMLDENDAKSDGFKSDSFKSDGFKSDDSKSEENLIFEDKGIDFDPPLNDEIISNSNNNKGEKLYVNPDTGEFLGSSTKASSAMSGIFAVDLSRVSTAEGNLDSQVSSDN